MSLTYRVTTENDRLKLTIGGLWFDTVPADEIVELVQQAVYEFGPPLPTFPVGCTVHNTMAFTNPCEGCHGNGCHECDGTGYYDPCDDCGLSEDFQCLCSHCCRECECELDDWTCSGCRG